MKGLIKTFLILNLYLLLASCSSFDAKVSSDFIFTKDDNSGLVIVSTSLQDQCNEAFYFYSTIRSNVSRSYFLYATAEDYDYDFIRPYPGRFYVLKFKPGMYKIDQVNIGYGQAGSAYAYLKNDIRFEVRKHEVVYIGEIEFTTTGEECGSVKYRVNNRWQRDRILFSKTIDKIDPNLVIQELAY